MRSSYLKLMSRPQNFNSASKKLNKNSISLNSKHLNKILNLRKSLIKNRSPRKVTKPKFHSGYKKKLTLSHRIRLNLMKSKLLLLKFNNLPQTKRILSQKIRMMTIMQASFRSYIKKSNSLKLKKTKKAKGIKGK